MRRLGAAAADMCHVALGIVEAYWEYCLKPWDMAAGVLVVIIYLVLFFLFVPISGLSLVPWNTCYKFKLKLIIFFFPY